MPRRRSSRRKNEDNKTGSGSSRRRRRRRPRNQTSTTSAASGQPARDGRAVGRNRAPHLELPPLTVGKAPRQAQPPSPDPQVFSYTYTIWKTT